MTQSLLSMEAVYASYGRAKVASNENGNLNGTPGAVLNGVSFGVAAGEVVGLIGPNGAGKSTLLRCALGLMRPQSGLVKVLGQDLSTYTRLALARTLAYVPQHSGAGMALSVADMVALGRSPHRGLHSAAHEQAVVFNAIERLQLLPLAMRPFSELSGGQRQRVLLARAVAQQARLMVLDEPTSDLDLRHQITALGVVRQLADEQGTAALIAIHDLALAGRYCDRLVLLHQGRVHAQGPWQQVLTPDNLAQVYGVAARVGVDGGRPYVLTETAIETAIDPDKAYTESIGARNKEQAHA